MNPPIIKIQDLSIALSGNEILKDISFDVTAGNYISIIGPNGAGKTTLIKCLAGIHSTWTGSIYLNGQSYETHSAKELAKRQSYVPQADGRTAPLTVEEFISMGRYPHLSPFTTLDAEDYTAIKSAIDRTGLEKFKHRKLNTLSGGERQMTFIAAALAQESEILLLDEPSSFLDYHHQNNVASILKSACEDDGKTIIAVHHNINTATVASDRIIAIKEGSIIFNGTPGEIANEQTLKEIYDTEFSCIPSPRTPHPFIVSGDTA